MGNPIVGESVGQALRIAVVSYYLPSGSKMGIGYQVHELATELVRRGHTVDVFSECPPVEEATYGHWHVKLPGSLRTFRFAAALRGVDFSGYDVIHAHGDDYWLWRRRVPRHIRTLHGSCFEEALKIRGLKERTRMVLLGISEVLASIVADQTVVVSPATRRWYPWVREVIPNGVDLDHFTPNPRPWPSPSVVLFVGSWFGRKRGRELAEIFARQVRPRHPAAELWMVCRDAPAATPSGVRILGALTADDLATVYRESSVFCLPSEYEGFGIPYIEAMASGVPVVATPNVGARYVTDEGAAGILVPLDQIGRAIADLLEDPDRRDSLVKAGLTRVRQFDLQRVVDRYETAFRGRTP